MKALFRGILAGWVAGSLAVLAAPPVPGEPTLVRGEASGSLVRPVEVAGEPWLGVSVHKPAEALYARLPGVPKGVGFVIHELAPDGPAAEAGLRGSDFVWMLDDQLLVNEAQFLVLLHLRAVGETVTLRYQRGGEDREAEVVLRERPPAERGRQLADVAIMTEPPVPGVPEQFVHILRQVASIKDADGVTVRLERAGEGFHWQQLDPQGVLIQEGDLKGGDDFRFPAGSNEELTKKLQAVIRAFEQAEKRAEGRARATRVRRVPVGSGE